jgi:carboxymethylenebutenolidase
MIERQVEIRTAGGAMSTFVVHPDRGGPFPVILFFMDAPGIREELRDMARRFASTGYYVLLPNMYYRAGVNELGPLPADPEAPARKRMFELMDSLTIPLVMDDAAALLSFAEADPMARPASTGAVGYCMSGRYAINAAVRFPAQVRAAASIYGVRLVMDEPDSPHVVCANSKAELYFACAETDRWMPSDQIDVLKEALASQPVKAEVEVFPGTDHGFAFPQRPVYNKAAAERHWERLHALYRRNLG